MSMFCYQCQEACKNTGCTVAGMCGKKEDTAQLQDMLVYAMKGLAVVADAASLAKNSKIGRLLCEGLFVTITNANYDNAAIIAKIEEVFEKRDEVKAANADKMVDLAECATWNGSASDFAEKAKSVGVMTTKNEDVRSLRELLIYGLKGLAAYTDHAAVLGKEDDSIYEGIITALASTTKDLSVDDMVAQVLNAGGVAVTAMATLDAANTETYGNPEITEVSTGVGSKPGILISGHDLKDMAMLLEQTQGTGVDVYTHSEMLPCHYYPAFKKYDNLVGNYGNAWWKQSTEFDSFNGPILLTTNCITPLKDSYKDRFFTTGSAGWPGATHIKGDADGNKDFSEIIEMAKTCQPPTEIEDGKIVGGFAHNQVFALADKVVEAVVAGDIKRFVVMAGCDGRQKGREYFTEVAKELPDNTVILTAGCAKYRYNKLELGDIGGIPRVLDAGQCNDCYSLVVIALKLKEVFELDDINELPLSFDIAWYEQKAVTVLLALLHLGVKGIRLGPSLPAFVSPAVLKVLVENFDIKPTGDVKEDVEAIMEGK
jgi:hydroxylamine reductase